MFTELPLLQRFDAAKEAGFDAVELWWPWATALPADQEVADLVNAIRNAGVRLIGLNFYAGDLAGPDCGAASVPKLSDAFRENISIALEIGKQLEVKAFNALYGNRIEGTSPQLQDELAIENLSAAATAVEAISAKILIEPVSGPKPYPLRTAADAVGVVNCLHASGNHNAAILFDVYHLTSNGDNVDTALTKYGDYVGHVQLADAPGRGEPGCGTIDFVGVSHRLSSANYSGYVALEYRPTRNDTIASLAAVRNALAASEFEFEVKQEGNR